MVRTRFAPSPTGSLHVGNARIAVLNWLYARQNSGVFIVRIEDTDTERTVPGSEAAILDDLRWLGLGWDEGPDAADTAWPGPNAPYRQSERAGYYREFGQWLLAAGLAYPCFCPPADLQAQREHALRRGEPPHYPGTCRRLTRAQASRLRSEGRTPAIRFAVPEDRAEVVVEDAVRGTVRVDAREIGDFVLLRSDGRATYNFAVVVDDALMEITHVIRGAGHLSNTPRQVLLYEALNQRLPAFAHVPTVLGPDRERLSKRHGARPLADYRREGYHPDALVNYLSLLSWSSPSEEEFLSRERLIEEISLERVRRSDVVFDPAKLKWLSSKHIEAMPVEDLVESVRPFVERSRHALEDEVLPSVVRAVRSHLSTFSEIDEHLLPFVPVTTTVSGGRLRVESEAEPVLAAVRDELAHVQAWTEEAIEQALRNAGRRADARGRALYAPVRMAVTGAEHGPPLVPLLAVRGREDVLRQLDRPGDPLD